ncbi:hypothetical protein APUTEX25_001178, partial [Auxenochlorella protothecoides]
ELGYSKQGAIRTATLHNLGLSVGAINLTPFATVKACSTEILVGVECLKPGQTACTADANGNIGTGNKGKDNFGSNNVGDHNIGELGVHTYIHCKLVVTWRQGSRSLVVLIAEVCLQELQHATSFQAHVAIPNRHKIAAASSTCKEVPAPICKEVASPTSVSHLLCQVLPHPLRPLPAHYRLHPSQPATDLTPSQPATDLTPSQPATDLTPSQPATDLTPSQPATTTISQPTDLTPSQPSTTPTSSQPTTVSPSQPSTAFRTHSHRCV